MPDLGKAYVQIVPSAEGIEGSITDIISPEAKMAGELSGASLGKELGAVAAKTIEALGIGKMISDSIGNGMDFEGSLTKASTLFSGTSEEFAALSDQIMDISSKTGVAASQLAEAAYSAESASVPMENLGGMIEASAQLATAGFTDIDTALSATAKTMNAYGMMSDDFAETQANMEKVQRILIQTQNKGITTVDELGASLAQVTPTAASFGVSFEQVGAALAGMTAQGTPTAQATTQLNSLIAELGKEGTTASNHFRELTEHIQEGGLSFAEAMERGWDMSDVLSLMDEGAAEAGVSMVDMFSSIEAGKAALSIWNSDWAGNMDAMATESDVVGEAYETMADTVSFKAEQIKTSLTNMGIEAFSASADTLQAILDGLSQIFEEVAPYVEKLGGAFVALGDTIGAMISDMLGLDESFSATDTSIEVLQLALSDVTDAVTWLSEHSEVLAAVIGVLAGAFIALNWPIVAVTGAIAAVVAVGIALYKNWDTIKSTLSNTWNSIKQTASSVWGSIKQTASTTWEGIKSTITKPIEAAKGTIKSIIDTIKGFFSFSISWPHIPMPHFAISPAGWKIGDLLKGSIPSLGIDWYAKGGVFESAALIGVGEKGREAAIPLQGSYMRPFARAIAEEMGGAGGNVFNVTMNATGTENPEQYAQRAVRELRRLARMGAI